MAETGWFELLAAALGGGITVKALDIAYQELRHRSERSRSAVRFVDEHLDPLLKAADELVGKLRSLAESDFRRLHDIPGDVDFLGSPDFSSLLYLFGRFWARIEILRQQGLSVAMSRDERGKRLQSFLDCLESRRVRIVDRISQRAVGEIWSRDKRVISAPKPSSRSSRRLKPKPRPAAGRRLSLKFSPECATHTLGRNYSCTGRSSMR